MGGKFKAAPYGCGFFTEVLVVVYAYSGEDEIRLISARKTTPKERRIYEEER